MRPGPSLLSTSGKADRTVSVSKRPNGRWRAQVETPAGQRAKIFVRKGDAQAWEGEQKAALRRGEFVDPVHGRITFAAFFDEWSKRQLWETGTQRAMSLAVRSVPFGDTPLAKIKRSHVEHWVKESPDSRPSRSGCSSRTSTGRTTAAAC